MKLYERSLIINILEAKILEAFEEYSPQGQYNGVFVSYLYKYIKNSIYSGNHNNFFSSLMNLKRNDSDFKTTKFEEKVNKKTFVITDDNGITNSMYTKLLNIFKNYYNYTVVVNSTNRVVIDVNFGWLPTTTISWLDLFNEDNLIDYYIDGITLRANTYNITSNIPDSGYRCYRIPNIKEYSTMLFLYDNSVELPTDKQFSVATLLNELESNKGATLNRIVDFDLTDFFYEVGPYSQNYISAEKSSLIIQVPYELTGYDNYYHLYDVSSSVKIDNENVKDEPNNKNNFFVSFENENFDKMFTRYDLKNREELIEDILNENNDFDLVLFQYLLGDFIWKTSDSKLIAYAQNLINIAYNKSFMSNGVWSDSFGSIIRMYKKSKGLNVDDVLDKETEEYLLADFRLKMPNSDPNEVLFNEW